MFGTQGPGPLSHQAPVLQPNSRQWNHSYQSAIPAFKYLHVCWNLQAIDLQRSAQTCKILHSQVLIKCEKEVKQKKNAEHNPSWI